VQVLEEAHDAGVVVAHAQQTAAAGVDMGLPDVVAAVDLVDPAVGDDVDRAEVGQLAAHHGHRLLGRDRVRAPGALVQAGVQDGVELGLEDQGDATERHHEQDHAGEQCRPAV
jgi:hypothetical protein